MDWMGLWVNKEHSHNKEAMEKILTVSDLSRSQTPKTLILTLHHTFLLLGCRSGNFVGGPFCFIH